MKLLPHWCLTDNHPAFYDMESGTAIEQTAKLYGAMQTLIAEYNDTIDKMNAHITEYENGINNSFECFKSSMIETMNNFVDAANIMFDNQNLKIQESIDYMTTNITELAMNVMNGLIENGKITVALSYNEETEELSMSAAVVEEG